MSVIYARRARGQLLRRRPASVHLLMSTSTSADWRPLFSEFT